MATAHIAFSFDAQSFNQMLVERIVVDNKMRKDLLYQLTLQKLENLSPTMKYALDMFRFGEDWIETSEEDVSLEFQWFLVVLASVLLRLPSLSDRYVFGHSLLADSLLNTDDWQQPDIDLLLNGNQDYRHLLSSPWDMILGKGIGLFEKNSYGMGWLTNRQVVSLLHKLVQTNDKFNVSSTMRIINKYNSMNFPIVHEEIKEIFEDAKVMLHTAIERNHDLFLILSA